MKYTYFKPEIDIVAAFTQEHILKESKYYIQGDMDDVEIIKGAWGDGYDNGDDFEIDSKGNSDLWDGWDD